MNAATLVDQVVAIERKRGRKILAAIAVASEILGVPYRKVFSHHYQEPVRLNDAPEQLVRFARYLEACIEKNEKENRDLLAVLRGLEVTDDLAGGVGNGCEQVAEGALVVAQVQDEALTPRERG